MTERRCPHTDTALRGQREGRRSGWQAWPWGKADAASVGAVGCPPPCTPSKAPGVLGKRTSRQNYLDGAWTGHTETGRNQDVAAEASARQPRQEGEQRPGGAPPGRLSRQLAHCGALMPGGAGSRTVGSQAGL